MENSDASSEQKFLVLIDFSKSSYNALKYAISLAKLIEAKLVLLYVAAPRDLVESDNPSVALRAIEIATKEKEVQFISIIEMIEAEGVSVVYHNTIGDLSKKINLHIELHRPDLLVIGKSRYGVPEVGETTNFLLNKFKGNLLIIGNDQEFNNGTKISVECNSETLNEYSSNVLFWLNKSTKEPLRVLVNKRKRSEEFMFPENWDGIADAPYKICVKNNQRFSLTKSIINHISKEKIDLVCIGRKSTNKSFFTKLFNRSNPTSEVINNARIPTLIMGEQTNF